MDILSNRFKAALGQGRQQIGLWCSLASPISTEVVAGSGFDWLLLDTEHSPADPITVLAALQAVAPYPVSAVVRPASNDTVLIKRFLDIGAQSLLVPYVQTAAEAEAALTVLGTDGPPTTSIKGVTGHALGAAGALEGAAVLLSIERRLIPPTANTKVVDLGIDVVTGDARPWEPGPTLSNNFGFGGHNGSIIFAPA